MVTVYDYTNSILCGDCKDWLERFDASKMFDLITIDPPFNAKNPRKGNVSNDDTPVITGYNDEWGGIYGYMDYMEPRIDLMFEKLKPGGSFYLHCDIHALGHLQTHCDKRFGHGVNSIIAWKRPSSHNDSKSWGRIHDSILFYQKDGAKPTFHTQYRRHPDGYFSRTEEETGRKYSVYKLSGIGLHPPYYEYEWNGVTKKWRIPIETMRKYDEKNLLDYSNTGNVYKKYYEDETNGIPIGDFWNDTPMQRGEKVYETQKPVSLARRIILASSNPGDMVLDAFCGSGTTLVAARDADRIFIGIDKNIKACNIAAERLSAGGRPRTRIIPIESADDIKSMDGFDFQRLICEWMVADQSERKTGDNGIDGHCVGTGAPLQIKKRRIGRADIDPFLTAIKRDKHDEGAIIGLTVARSDRLREEVSRIKREEGVSIHVYSYEDIQKGAHVTDGVSIRIGIPKRPIKTGNKDRKMKAW